MNRNGAQRVLIGMGVAAALVWVVLSDPGQLGSVEPGGSRSAAAAPAATTGGGVGGEPYDPMQDYVETLQWWHLHPDWGASVSAPSCPVDG